MDLQAHAIGTTEESVMGLGPSHSLKPLYKYGINPSLSHLLHQKHLQTHTSSLGAVIEHKG